ncbi:MAG: hypothetical protein ACRYHQ_10155 [Janthinobacterium lividum]
MTVLACEIVMHHCPSLRPTFDVHLPRIVEDTERRGPPGSGIALALLLVAPFWAAVFAVWFWWPTVCAWAGVAWRVLRLVGV